MTWKWPAAPGSARSGSAGAITRRKNSMAAGPTILPTIPTTWRCCWNEPGSGLCPFHRDERSARDRRGAGAAGHAGGERPDRASARGGLCPAGGRRDRNLRDAADPGAQMAHPADPAVRMKRFYKEVEAEPAEGGFRVTLD